MSQMLGLDLTHGSDLLMLLVGLALLYAASRAAVDALVRGDEASPGRRAIGHVIPVGAVAIAAVLLRQPELAVGVLFGVSVASLSLGSGVIAISSEQAIATPGIWRRVWPFVVVVAVLALMAGFSGYLKLWHAGMFAVEGIVLLLMWWEKQAGAEPVAQAAGRRVNPAILVLALILAAVGAYAASRGAIRLSTAPRAPSMGTIAATMMGPMLVLPMLGTGSFLASRKLGGAAITVQVGVVLLSLCLFLPITIGLAELRPAVKAPVATQPVTISQPATTPSTRAAATSEPATEPATGPAEPGMDGGPPTDQELVFPILVWRIDTVVLLLLGLILLPAAVGRWAVTRRDGFLLLLIYVAYLMASAAGGLRP